MFLNLCGTEAENLTEWLRGGTNFKLQFMKSLPGPPRQLLMTVPQVKQQTIHQLFPNVKSDWNNRGYIINFYMWHSK